MECLSALTENPYLSLDELDAEAREDVEVALYGMLHHSTLDEISCVESSSTENCPATDSPTEPAKTDKKLNTIIQTPREKDSNLNVAAKRNSSGKTPSPSKLFPPRENHLVDKQVIKRSPYSEYLVIEKSRKSISKIEKQATECEVITLSDEEEDSKYASIAKATCRKSTSNGKIQNSSHNSSHIQGKSYDSSSEDSETDNSVTVLETPKSSRVKPDGTNHFSSSTVDLGDCDSPPIFSESDSSSTSDSDSDVKVLSSTTKRNYNVELQLNTSQQGIDIPVPYINTSVSTPGWEQYSSTKWTPEMIRFYDREGQNTDLNAIMNSIPKHAEWYLCQEDRRGNHSGNNRYFGKANKVRCTVCHQWDHAASDCAKRFKLPSCHICGMQDHKTFGCPTKVCLSCGRQNRTFVERCWDCKREIDTEVCAICCSKHHTQRCPDLWRRYHMTTVDRGELVQTGGSLKPQHQLYCCNCASRGHTVNNCKVKRFNMCMPATVAVMSYENPKDYLQSLQRDRTFSEGATDNCSKQVCVVKPSPIKSSRREEMRAMKPSEKPLPRKGQVIVLKPSEILLRQKERAIAEKSALKKSPIEDQNIGHDHTQNGESSGSTTVATSPEKPRQPKEKKFIVPKKLRNDEDTEFHLKVAETYVLENIANVKITRRVSNNICTKISFRGNGDTCLAKNKFKAIFRASCKVDKKESSGKGLEPTAEPTQKPIEKPVTPKHPWVLATSTQINYKSREGKEMRHHFKFDLSARKKRQLGKLLDKLEMRHRVHVTSCMVGETWEITVHSLIEGPSAITAFLSLLRVLNHYQFQPLQLPRNLKSYYVL